jgi:hypothetical protein
MGWKDKIKRRMAAKRDVFVAIPTLSGRTTVGITHFLNVLERLSLSPDCPWRFSWQVVNGRRPVEYARNVLIGIMFNKSPNAEKLWFIDEDMIPTETSLQLLDVDADIVAGRAWAFDASAPGRDPALRLCLFDYNKNGDAKFNPIVPQEGDDVLPIVGAGTATMVISRRVLDDKRMWFSDEYESVDGKLYKCSTDVGTDDYAPPVFRTVYAPNGKILRGEDLDFCLRAHELGYQVRAHVGSQFGHLKEINIDDVAMLCELVARRVSVNSPNSNMRDLATLASFAHEREVLRYADQDQVA